MKHKGILFQSTPAITGERAAMSDELAVCAEEFQSTPAITGERALASKTYQPSVGGFNPRPPLLASEPGSA